MARLVAIRLYIRLRIMHSPWWDDGENALGDLVLMKYSTHYLQLLALLPL